MNYQDILKSINWPTDILTLDFESYFDQEYSLRKMSTIEYIMSPEFELTGVGLGPSRQLFPDGPLANCFIEPPDINYNLTSIEWDYFTVVVQNSRFDATILKEKFDITPKYIIDILDLARHYDSRMSHTLKSLCTLFKLKPKGDTKQFAGLRYKDMTPEQRKALQEYNNIDIENETELVKILLPYITNPEVEIPLMRHTLKMYLEPRILFDFRKAGTLRADMQTELEKALKKVSWVQEYAG